MTDFSKLRKSLEKKEFTLEMNDPTEWVSTGSAVLNYRLTGRLDVGLANKRTMLLWGQSGSGKSFLSSNICRNVQEKGYKIIYLDSEESISEDYMRKIGVDMSDEMFIPVMVDTLEDVTEAVSIIFSEMEEDDKFCLVVDSLAGLLSEKELKEFEKGESKGDQGQFAKKLKLLTKNLNKKIAEHDAFCVLVSHAYQNQDIYSGEGKWIPTGGKGFQFFPSFSVLLDKAKMKAEKIGGKRPQGFRMKAEITKTRFTAPNQTCELTVPYDRGMDFYDGILEILEEEGVVKKNGAWYSYEKDGETHKFQQNTFEEHADNVMEIANADALEEEINEELEVRE